MGCTHSSQQVETNHTSTVSAAVEPATAEAEKQAAAAADKSTTKRIPSSKLPIIGANSIMSPKKHGTSETPVQRNLQWNCDVKKADKICNFNRHFAEHSGYFTTRKAFLKACQQAKDKNQTITFYDSNTGNPLFTAPQKRSWDEFLRESRSHGWPSFRDAEVNWDHVRCLRGGECVSLDGTHLGHNLPDRRNRYCINLVSVAGRPKQQVVEEQTPEGA